MHMKQLHFEDYEELARDIADTFDSLDDECGEVSVIAKYDEAKEIIRELLCIGYNIASVDLHKEEFENYFDEYIISLNFDGVWCEKFKRKNGYFTDESNATYIMDNCSSAVIPYCKSKNVYEVSVDNQEDENSETAHEYTVNGKNVDKKAFDEYVCKFAPDKTNKEDISENDGYSISLKCELDTDEVLEIIKYMEWRMDHMNDIFREIDCFRRLLFNW